MKHGTKVHTINAVYAFQVKEDGTRMVSRDGPPLTHSRLAGTIDDGALWVVTEMTEPQLDHHMEMELQGIDGTIYTSSVTKIEVPDGHQ